jgi:hypothetical protein
VPVVAIVMMVLLVPYLILVDSVILLVLRLHPTISLVVLTAIHQDLRTVKAILVVHIVVVAHRGGCRRSGRGRGIVGKGSTTAVRRRRSVQTSVMGVLAVV